MSEGDKLLEGLGYKITEKVENTLYHNGIQYMKKDKNTNKYIEFYYYHKEIVIYTEQIIRGEIVRWESAILNMQELKAINLKCKELGWIEE